MIESRKHPVETLAEMAADAEVRMRENAESITRVESEREEMSEHLSQMRALAERLKEEASHIRKIDNEVAQSVADDLEKEIVDVQNFITYLQGAAERLNVHIQEMRNLLEQNKSLLAEINLLKKHQTN